YCGASEGEIGSWSFDDRPARDTATAGGGGLVRTGFSPLGRIAAFPAKRPLAQLLPSGQCAQPPMFTGLNISPVKRASRELQSCEERFLAALPVQGGTWLARRDEAGLWCESRIVGSDMLIGVPQRFCPVARLAASTCGDLAKGARFIVPLHWAA